MHALDVRDEDAVQALIDTIRERHGRLDVLVNNAGVGGAWPLFEMSKDDWHTIVDASLTGSFLCSKHAAKLMIDGRQRRLDHQPRLDVLGLRRTALGGLRRGQDRRPRADAGAGGRARPVTGSG